MRSTHDRRRTGQAMIFAIMIVIILSFIALWNFDLHKTFYVKSLSQNAGDASALAAARWQATTLNLIGDLNILKAVALSQGQTSTADEIGNLQARLCYVGPIVGMVAAQQAAKNNGVLTNPRFTERVRRHADVVRNDYPTRVDPQGQMLFPEPYPGCWQEYSDMLYMLADNGIAAGPDNARLYEDYVGGHILLEMDFYDAVAGRDWCWFFFNEPTLLESYTDYHWWPPLPEQIPHTEPMNSEYFGLALSKIRTIGSVATVNLMEQLEQQRGLGTDPISNFVANATSVWYCYDTAIWTPWDAMSLHGDPPFPATGPVKPQYDYAGADSAVRVLTETRRLMPGASPATVLWTAAAKPFGYLNEQASRPDSYAIVLPAYHNIRLIPIDASSAPAGGAFDLDWREHIEVHLPEYMDRGLAGITPTCWFCQQLVTWEDPVFRQTGIDWLELYSDTCLIHGGGPGSAGGGRRRGH